MVEFFTKGIFVRIVFRRFRMIGEVFDKMEVRLGSLGRLESNGMFEIVGHRAERIFAIFVKII